VPLPSFDHAPASGPLILTDEHPTAGNRSPVLDDRQPGDDDD
jgi:hypothetical protein